MLEMAWVGETAAVRKVLENHFNQIESIEPPGTVEGGDIMMVGSHFYLGLSERTNEEGARQMSKILEKHGPADLSAQAPDLS